MAGKGDKRRKGEDNQKFRDNFDKIFKPKKEGNDKWVTPTKK